MSRMAVLAAAVLVALIPAAVGLLGNPSFGRSVPVHAPPTVVVTAGELETDRTTADDHGSDDERQSGDDGGEHTDDRRPDEKGTHG